MPLCSQCFLKIPSIPHLDGPTSPEVPDGIQDDISGRESAVKPPEETEDSSQKIVCLSISISALKQISERIEQIVIKKNVNQIPPFRRSGSRDVAIFPHFRCPHHTGVMCIVTEFMEEPGHLKNQFSDVFIAIFPLKHGVESGVYRLNIC